MFWLKWLVTSNKWTKHRNSLFLSLSVCLPACLSVSACLPACLPVCLSVFQEFYRLEESVYCTHTRTIGFVTLTPTKYLRYLLYHAKKKKKKSRPDPHRNARKTYKNKLKIRTLFLCTVKYNFQSFTAFRSRLKLARAVSVLAPCWQQILTFI